MKLQGLMTIFALAVLSSGCAFLSSPPRQETDQGRRAKSLTTPEERLTTARQLGWEAALLVQKPPHSIATWQTAKIKWRRAIQLLEAIPEGTAVTTPARAKLAVYRRNYAAIQARLVDEQTAADQFVRAQELAWQAAVTVQSPPLPLGQWQRATQKWQRAIALLESVPVLTSIFPRSQEKLVTYRQNYQEIKQRVLTETIARQTLQEFLERAEFLKRLSAEDASPLALESIGISYQDYVEQVRGLETSLEQFSRQPGARYHLLYADLQGALADYRFALSLWQSYLAFKRANAEWLQGDFFNLLTPVSAPERLTLAQKYQVSPSPSVNTKVSLRAAVWEIWRHASEDIEQAQMKLLTLK